LRAVVVRSEKPVSEARERSLVGSHDQATVSEDSEDIVCITGTFEAYYSERLSLFGVMFHECPTIPNTNPNPFYRHPPAAENIKYIYR
jgi:hypothetical protein